MTTRIATSEPICSALLHAEIAVATNEVTWPAGSSLARCKRVLRARILEEREVERRRVRHDVGGQATGQLVAQALPQQWPGEAADTLEHGEHEAEQQPGQQRADVLAAVQPGDGPVDDAARAQREAGGNQTADQRDGGDAEEQHGAGRPRRLQRPRRAAPQRPRALLERRR